MYYSKKHKNKPIQITNSGDKLTYTKSSSLQTIIEDEIIRKRSECNNNEPNNEKTAKKVKQNRFPIKEKIPSILLPNTPKSYNPFENLSDVDVDNCNYLDLDILPFPEKKSRKETLFDNWELNKDSIKLVFFFN